MVVVSFFGDDDILNDRIFGFSLQNEWGNLDRIGYIGRTFQHPAEYPPI